MRKDLLPSFIFLFSILVAREIYPYAVSNPNVDDKYQVQIIAEGLGGPTCLHFIDSENLLLCDRDGGRILLFDANFSSQVLIEGLHHPHGVLVENDTLFVSESGRLTKYDFEDNLASNPEILVEGIPSKNHQTNTINKLPNGTLIWHSGSTCNVCVEADERNGALLWVNSSTGEHGILASGVRNSYDGVWVESIGYVFTDNGRDWEGDHPHEEINLLVEGGDYGWPNDTPETPVPAGSIPPIAVWTPHTSVNGIDVRPPNSDLPGTNTTVYASVFGSWNTLLPQGHEIIRIDLGIDGQGHVVGEPIRFATDLGTPLPLRFHPDGDLYYATFGNGGTLYKISLNA